MSVTIMEALMNAKYNLIEGRIPLQMQMGKEQLNNAVTLLEKGYSLEDNLDDLIEEHGSVDGVPERIAQSQRVK